VAAAGGLGQPILAGFATFNTAFLIEGVLLVAILALLVDRVLTPPVSAPRCDRVQQSPRTRDTAPRPHPHPKGLARRDEGESDSVIAWWPISAAVDQFRAHDAAPANRASRGGATTVAAFVASACLRSRIRSPTSSVPTEISRLSSNTPARSRT